MVMTAKKPSTRERPKAALEKNCIVKVMDWQSTSMAVRKMFNGNWNLGS